MTAMEDHEAGIAHRNHWYRDERGINRYCPGSGHLSDDALALQRWLAASGESEAADYDRW